MSYVGILWWLTLWYEQNILSWRQIHRRKTAIILIYKHSHWTLWSHCHVATYNVITRICNFPLRCNITSWLWLNWATHTFCGDFLFLLSVQHTLHIKYVYNTCDNGKWMILTTVWDNTWETAWRKSDGCQNIIFFRPILHIFNIVGSALDYKSPGTPFNNPFESCLYDTLHPIVPGQSWQNMKQ